MLLQAIKPRLVWVFNLSEHCCAIGYATSEFAFEHTKLILNISSGILLACLACLLIVKMIEHYRQSKIGYRPETVHGFY